MADTLTPNRQHHSDRPLPRRRTCHPRPSEAQFEDCCQRQDCPGRHHLVSPDKRKSFHFTYTLATTLSDQIFNVRQTIAFLSQGTTLLPGSIIMTGTPKGVGFVKKPPVYLKDGDDMSVWLAGGIGTLYNPVVEERGSEKAKL